MIVIIDLITRKEAIKLGHVKIKHVKILLQYLIELRSKSKTFCKWSNNEGIMADGGPGASSVTNKHLA